MNTVKLIWAEQCEGIRILSYDSALSIAWDCIWKQTGEIRG